MRVTNSIMLRRYSANLGLNLKEMNRTSQQVSSFRKFQKGSEDPMSALKALQARKTLTALDQYAKNIDTADSWLSQTEIAVSSVKKVADEAIDLLIQGRNDPMATEDRKIIAGALRNLQEQLLKNLNSQISNKYILGGTNTKEAPFTVDYTTGELFFNGQSVNAADSIDDIKPDPVYYDLGLGFKMDEMTDMPDPNSVFDMYLPGINIIGVGEFNLYSLVGKLATAFENEDMASIDGYESLMPGQPSTIDPELQNNGLFKRLQDAQLNALIELTTVGEKTKFVEYIKNRTETNIYQTEVMINKLEAIEPDKAIMNFKMQEMVYQACLQMGTYIFQPSLMDYIKR